MPPKKDAGKGKGKGKSDGDTAGSGTGKLKSAQSINVRHILVRQLAIRYIDGMIMLTNRLP